MRTNKRMIGLVSALMLIGAGVVQATVMPFTGWAGINYNIEDYYDAVGENYGSRISSSPVAYHEDTWGSNISAVFTKGNGWTSHIELTWAPGVNSDYDTYTSWNGRGDVAQTDGSSATNPLDIVFTPDAGYGVLINSFALDEWVGSATEMNWFIFDDTGTLASGHWSGFGGAGGRSTINTGLTTVDIPPGKAVTLRFEQTSGNTTYTAVDNIDFDEILAEALIDVAPTSLNVSEEGPTSDSYQIVLAYEPNADGPGAGGADTVLILCEPNGAGSGKDTDINIGNGPGGKIILTFTSDSWDTPQTITVTAVNDSDIEGDRAVEIRHRVLSAADPNYAGAYVPKVTVNITDNDIPEITLIETRDYTYVSESGATDSYTLSLNIQPTAELTIEILQDSNELRLNGAGAGASVTLTFTTTNWDTAQTVTVAAAQDDIYEGDHTALITHTVGGTSQYATWPDAGGVTIADVYVYIGDDDPETLTDGLVAYYPLDGNPNDYSGNGHHGTLVAAHPDWVTGVLGGALDMDAQEYISIGVADIVPPWTASMWVKRQDNPNPGAILMRSSAFALKLEQWYNTKNVGFTRFGVADYNFGYSAPLESWVHLVFVGTKSGTTLWVDGEARGYVGASISCPMNTISAASESLYAVLDEVAIWERALSGTEIRKLHDGTETDPDPILHLRLDNDLVDSSGRSNHGIMASVDADDPNWVAGKMLGALQFYGDDYVTMDGVARDITDNDTTWNLWVNITQSKTWHTLLAVNTAGGGNVVMLELANGEPDIYEADGEQAYTGVNIIDGQWHMLTYVRSGAIGTIYIDGAPKATHSAVSYNFSANDRWSLAQEWDGGPTPSDFAIGTIDDVLVWDRALSLSEVQELYNDGAGMDYPNPAGLQIVQTDGATEVNEEGATSDTYTVALNNQPGGTVVVTVDSADPNITVLGAPVSLTFTSANWDTPQTITVRAVDDLIFFELDHAAVITHTAAGDPNYDGFVDTLTVIVIDNDVPAVTVVPTTLSIFEGESATYTVALSDEPVKETGDVLVTVDPNDGGYGLELDLGAGAGEPITLTFTKTSWDTAQTVTVMVLENTVLTSDRSATITHMVSSDGAYDGIAVDSVSVSIKEDECGYWGYSPMDFNQDCRVDLLDLHEFLSEWLICTDPVGSGCIKGVQESG